MAWKTRMESRHGVGKTKARGAGDVGGHDRAAQVTRTSLLPKAKRGAGGGRLRPVGRAALCPLLRRWRGPAVDSAGGLLSHDLRRLLRGPRVATRHRLALQR